MRAADLVITIAEAMRDDIVERGVTRDRVTRHPQRRRRRRRSTPMPPDPELRRRYGLDGRPSFGYVSNLDHPRENQELLIEATARLAAAAATSPA